MHVYFYFMNSLHFIYTNSCWYTPTLPQTPHAHKQWTFLYVQVTVSLFFGYLPSRKLEGHREHTYVLSLNSAMLLRKWWHPSTFPLAIQKVPVSLYPCHYLVFYFLILAHLVGVESPSCFNLYFSDYLDILVSH